MRSLNSISAFFFLAGLFSCAQNQGEFPETMTYVEGGVFIMGTTSSIIDSLSLHYGFPRDFLQSEYPPHKVAISPFYVDKYEATNEDFMNFIKSNLQWSKNNIPDSLHNGNYLSHWHGDSYPNGEDRFPVYNISWYAAVAFCQWQKKRLPTEAEWEFMASNRGLERIYPWGDSNPDSLKANYYNLHGRAIEVGKYPPNDLGIFDLAGNVWEYTLDEWTTDFYQNSPFNDPVNGSKQYDVEDLYKVTTRRVIRGGSWGGTEVNLRVSFRDSHPPEGAGDHVGCRCVKEIFPKE